MHVFLKKIYVRLCFFMYCACCLTQTCLEPLNEHILYSAERFLPAHSKAAGGIIRYAYHLHRPPGAGDTSFIQYYHNINFTPLIYVIFLYFKLRLPIRKHWRWWPNSDFSESLINKILTSLTNTLKIGIEWLPFTFSKGIYKQNHSEFFSKQIVYWEIFFCRA